MVKFGFNDSNDWRDVGGSPASFQLPEMARRWAR